jgi:hypothetical protein
MVMVSRCVGLKDGESKAGARATRGLGGQHRIDDALQAAPAIELHATVAPRPMPECRMTLASTT